MIKTQREYEEALNRMADDREHAAAQRRALEQAGLSPDQVERAMQPLLAFQAQLAEEVQWYERVRRREFEPSSLASTGRLLMALRIANDLTQRELAERLGVPESQISRWERNEYYGISVERAQSIAEAMGEAIVTGVKERHTGQPVVTR